jgi:hypothetical protein
MIEDGLGKAALARKLNVSPEVIDRRHNLSLARRIDQIEVEAALAVFGKRLAVGPRNEAYYTNSTQYCNDTSHHSLSLTSGGRSGAFDADSFSC